MSNKDLYDTMDYLHAVEENFSRNIATVCLKGQMVDVHRIIEKLARTRTVITDATIKKQLSSLEQKARSIQNAIYQRLTGRDAVVAA